MLNGDVVRNMTNEELAGFRPYWRECPFGMEKSCKAQKSCNSCWKKWMMLEQNFTYELLPDGSFVAKEIE